MKSKMSLPIDFIIALLKISNPSKSKPKWEITHDDKERELGPPDQYTVTRRALCLGALVLRAEYESVIMSNYDTFLNTELKKRIKLLKKWLKNNLINKYQSKQEKKLFVKRAGGWTENDLIIAQWRTESVGIILWALSLFEDIPPYDSPFDQTEVISKFGLMGPPDDFIKKAQLRPQDKIVNARDVAELWNWRSVTTQIIQAGIEPPNNITYDQIIKIATEAAYESGQIGKPMMDDFPLFGKAYKNLNAEEYHTANSVAYERHFALNWLCGYSRNWDKTPTDT